MTADEGDAVESRVVLTHLRCYCGVGIDESVDVNGIVKIGVVVDVNLIFIIAQSLDLDGDRGLGGVE